MQGSNSARRSRMIRPLGFPMTDMSSANSANISSFQRDSQSRLSKM